MADNPRNDTNKLEHHMYSHQRGWNKSNFKFSSFSQTNKTIFFNLKIDLTLEEPSGKIYPILILIQNWVWKQVFQFHQIKHKKCINTCWGFQFSLIHCLKVFLLNFDFEKLLFCMNIDEKLEYTNLLTLFFLIVSKFGSSNVEIDFIDLPLAQLTLLSPK